MSIEREAALKCDNCGVVGVRGFMPFPSKRVRAQAAMKGWTFTTEASTPRGGCKRTDRCAACTDEHFARRAAEAIAVPPNRTGTPEESQAIADWHHDEIQRRAAESNASRGGEGGA